MALSNTTYINLAKALKYEVCDYILTDERYMNFMMKMTGDAIISKLGQLDENVLGELSMCVIDMLDIRPTP